MYLRRTEMVAKKRLKGVANYRIAESTEEGYRKLVEQGPRQTRSVSHLKHGWGGEGEMGVENPRQLI